MSKTMTPEEILKCHIPYGKFSSAMERLKYDLAQWQQDKYATEKDISSLCAAFTALYAVAKFDYVHFDKFEKVVNELTEQFNSEIPKLVKMAYKTAISDVLKVVDEMEKEHSNFMEAGKEVFEDLKQHIEGMAGK